ncbi:hypothetical protein PTKIN_Ptkin16aG0506000 [Pterospermum kingtungense]
MKSLSSVGLGLSIVFGCLLLALIAELYYLLWWKKRLTTSTDLENDYSNPTREFLYMFCWKRSSSASMTHSALNPQEIRAEMQSNKDLLLKPFGNHQDDHGGMESELMRLHSSVSGPPRFLFTIIEETKEEMESEEAKSKGDNKSRGRSLSDLLLTVETPYLTPLASPPFFTPPLTPSMDASNYSHQLGFNPLFESAADAEFNRLRSSPPPKFKFLQEAEEKLHRKKSMEEEVHNNGGFDQENGDTTPPSKYLKDEEDGSFITIIVDRNKERGCFNHNHQHQFHSSTTTSQVLPVN